MCRYSSAKAHIASLFCLLLGRSELELTGKRIGHSHRLTIHFGRRPTGHSVDHSNQFFIGSRTQTTHDFDIRDGAIFIDGDATTRPSIPAFSILSGKRILSAIHLKRALMPPGNSAIFSTLDCSEPPACEASGVEGGTDTEADVDASDVAEITDATAGICEIPKATAIAGTSASERSRDTHLKFFEFIIIIRFFRLVVWVKLCVRADDCLPRAQRSSVNW